MGAGLLTVKRGFILFNKDLSVFTQYTRLRERERERETDSLEVQPRSDRGHGRRFFGTETFTNLELTSHSPVRQLVHHSLQQRTTQGLNQGPRGHKQ